MCISKVFFSDMFNGGKDYEGGVTCCITLCPSVLDVPGSAMSIVCARQRVPPDSDYAHALMC